MKNFKSITTFILVTALLSSCGSKDKKGMQNTDETPMVQVQSVFAENVAETSDYSATVEAFKTNNIMSNTGNRIKRILVDVGSHVSAGQAVVILDNITSVNQESAIAGQRAQVEGQRAQVEGQRASVANQDAALASQEAALKTDEINIARQKKDLDRAKELVRIGGGTQQTVDQLQAAYDASLEALKARKRALEASKASLQASRTSLEASHTSYGASQTSLGASRRQMQTVQENTTLRSPISGVVTARNYFAGDLPTGPILTIQQLSPLKVVVSVNEEEFPKIRTGMPVSVTFDVVPGETFTGTVHLIHPEIDQATRTFKVEVTIGNGGGKISSGMFARVQFNYGSASHIVVPDKAIVKMQGAGIRYVYVLEPNGTVRYVEVKLGKRLGDRYEVLSGLSNGDQVVIAGQSRLTNGAKVQVQKK